MLRAALIALALAITATPAAADAADYRGEFEKAARFYRTLAEKGDAAAQYSLAIMYDSGLGVPQDYAEAVKWYRKAAEQGLGDAQASLGYMYQLGQGVSQDDVLAHMWFDLAVAHGTQVAGYALRYRDDIAERMTPEQIAEAQRLAREWMAKHQ